jgi:putative membrane protein
MGILLRLAASAAAVWLATLILPGIDVTAETTAGTIGTYVAIAVLFGVVNAVLRPIIKMVGCGLYVVTLGLIAFVVNGLLLLLTSFIAGLIDLPFHVESFWPDALLGALLIGVASWLINMFIRTARD